MAQPLSYGCTWQLVSTHESTSYYSQLLPHGGLQSTREAQESPRVTEAF